MKYISLLWEPGKVFDRWSVVHFLSGAEVAFVGSVLNLSFEQTVVIGVILFVAWEAFEVWRGIKETVTNRLTDIVIGVLGLAFLFSLLYTDQDTGLAAGVVISVILPILSFVGWRAYLVRTRGESPSNVQEVYQNLKEDIKK